MKDSKRQLVWEYLKENPEVPLEDIYNIFNGVHYADDIPLREKHGKKLNYRATLSRYYREYFEYRDYFLEGIDQMNEGIWRIKVLKRDNFTCQLCGYKPARVVHHINSRNYYPNLKYAIDNGLTVCDKCHKSYHRGNGGSTDG